VENDITVREDIAEVLRERGYTVDEANNGRVALDLLRRGEPPAAILLDLRAPIMTGWEFVEELRKDATIAALPIIVMSGDPDIAHPARALSAAGFLRKPFGLIPLLDVLLPHAPLPPD
jgi:two-component system, response regulator, stage 0 sporulation protein F